MGGFKLFDRFKSTQVHAFSSHDSNSSSTTTTTGGGAGSKLSNRKLNFTVSKKSNKANSDSALLKSLLFHYGLPDTDLLQPPPIDPHLKPIHYVECLSDLYSRIETCSQPEVSMLCIEQYSLLQALGDPKLLRRSLRAARQYAVDVHSKIVLSAWLRFERREDELVGVSGMDCNGLGLECPKTALVPGFDPEIVFHRCRCRCSQDDVGTIHEETFDHGLTSKDDDNFVSFRIGNDEIICVRSKIASLSRPFQAMLSGEFVESRSSEIEFSLNDVSVDGMRAVERFSRSKRLDSFLSPKILLEILSFATRFCCEEMKNACDARLASSVDNLHDALTLIEYGLEERANLLVASCLQVVLRELPGSGSIHDPKVITLFRNPTRLSTVGHASFLLYYFLSQVAMEENIASTITVMLTEKIKEIATEKWQKVLAFHQLGCVMLERNEYENARHCFVAAAEQGHVYSIAGVARTMYKQGERYSAFQLMNRLIVDHNDVAWMYQERSLYNVGEEKTLDLTVATRLDPTLSFPYKYRAVMKVEEKRVREAISEIDRVIEFKLMPDCLELRVWFFIAVGDYESALRDLGALLTLEPSYKMFHGKVGGDRLIEVLTRSVEGRSCADYWMRLYDRWSSVDDIGSLAVIHQMLINDPRKSVLRFRQSLLLLRLNCQKAAMRCLRLARNDSSTRQEMLVYEGWILYDIGHHEEALLKAQNSISIQRSFEAFFLQAYILADRNMDPEPSSSVIELLEEALRCPSDGLRKGQALNNLGSIYLDRGNLDLAENCYKNALDIKHTRAHQGLARVYFLKNKRKAAYDEMSKLIEKAHNNASAYEKRSEYCERDMTRNDLNIATQLDPLRTYPYRYRAAVLMDEQKDNEAIQELTKAISFKPDLQMLHLRAAFYESMGDLPSALRDCQAALCLDPDHADTLHVYNRTKDHQATTTPQHQQGLGIFHCH